MIDQREEQATEPSKHIPDVEGTAFEVVMARLKRLAAGSRRPDHKLSQAERLAFGLFRRGSDTKD